MAAPTTSVVIPTYNRAPLLGRAVKSVLEQSDPDLEVIIVDDASTDATASLVESFRDPRVHYLRLTENGGNAVARNAGVRRARGRYVSFLDSDDEFLPDFLAAMRSEMDRSPPDVGFGWVGRYEVRITAHGRVRVAKPTFPPAIGDDPYYALLRRLRGGTGHGLTVKRERFEEVGLFDESLRAAVDSDFVLRLAQHCGFVEVQRPLVRHFQHRGARVSQNSGDRARAYRQIIEKHRSALERDALLWAQFHHKTARLLYEAGERAEGRRYVSRALRRRPVQLRSWVLLLLNETLGRRGPHSYRALAAHVERGREFWTARVPIDELSSGEIPEEWLAGSDRPAGAA